MAVARSDSRSEGEDRRVNDISSGGIHSPIGGTALLLARNRSVTVGHLLPPSLLDLMVAVVKQRGLEQKDFISECKVPTQ